VSRAATAQVGHPVDEAMLEGKITPAQRPGYIKMWQADPEGTAKLLASMPQVVPLKARGGSAPEGGERRVRQEAYPASWLAGHRPPDTGPGSITKVSD
jgi:Mu-like prophage I protein